MKEISDLIYVNFKWSILMQVGSFDEVEKSTIKKKINNIDNEQTEYPCINVRNSGRTLKCITYTDTWVLCFPKLLKDFERAGITIQRQGNKILQPGWYERDKDYKCVNDILMVIRDAFLEQITGKKRSNGKAKTTN